MSLHVMIVGAGRVGAALAHNLVADGHRVVVVEQRPDRRDWLAAEVPGATVVLGDGTDPDLLDRHGARTMDVLVAVTDLDHSNVLAAGLAKDEFGVARTIARVVDPRHAWLFVPALGVDVALEQADLIARLVAEEMSLGEITTLVKLRRGQYALVEERVHPAARAVGRAVRDLDLPSTCTIVGLLRDEALVPVDGGVVLEPDDELLVVVHAGAAAALQDLLGPATVR